MKQVSIIILILISMNAEACPVIQGTWLSSKELSMEHNLKYTEMNEKQINTLNQILGMYRNTFSNGVVHVHPAATHVEAGENTHEFVIEESESEYSVMECEKNYVKLKGGAFGSDEITEYNFVSSKVYWVKTFNGRREYFVKTAI